MRADGGAERSEVGQEGGWLIGVRFGMASAIISAVVILLSLRPMRRFQFTIIASLIMIAFVDSLADGYALMNRAGTDTHATETAVGSIIAKMVICATLAFLVYRTRPGRAAPNARIFQVYAATATLVVFQIGFTAFTGPEPEALRFRHAAILAGLFVGAVALSLLLRRLLNRIHGAV